VVLKRGSYRTGRYIEFTVGIPRLYAGRSFEENKASASIGVRVEDEPLLELDCSYDGECFASCLDWLLPDRRRDENAKGWCRRR
jgi:hypothetical protein